MIGTSDPYYNRPEISNSDLSALLKMSDTDQRDLTDAYRFGNLIDAMITEPHRVDHYRLRVDQEQFNATEWEQARRMLQAFRDDHICAMLLSQAGGQAIKSREVEITHEGVKFTIPMRCKYDLWMEALGWGADIKSTTATSQKQFEQVVEHFHYDRQRAVYMTLSGAPKDMIIGISKENFKIFKVAITRESDLFKTGMAKFQQLAFMHFALFHDVKLNNIPA